MTRHPERSVPCGSTAYRSAWRILAPGERVHVLERRVRRHHGARWLLVAAIVARAAGGVCVVGLRGRGVPDEVVRGLVGAGGWS